MNTAKLRIMDLSDENIAQAIHLLDGNADDMEGFDPRAWQRVKEMIPNIVEVLHGEELVEVLVIALDSDPNALVLCVKVSDPDFYVWFTLTDVQI